MKSKQFLYQLTFNSEQAVLIARALDFWNRCHAGQLEELRFINLDVDSDEEIKALKKVLFPDLGPAASKFNFKYGREAFNLRKVIEHAVSWNEKPLQSGQLQTVNYDGPLDSWWETSPPAVMLVYEDKEAVRIRDEVNRTRFLGRELEDVIGTSDIQEATKLIKKWKKAFDKCQAAN